MSKKEVVTGSFFQRRAFRTWAIVLAVLCVYGKTLQFGLVELDDRELIVDNYAYISDLSNIPKAFTTHVFYNPTGTEGSNVYYRPVLTLSFMLDALWGGQSLKFYHLSNLLFHIVCCFLLLKLLVKLKLNPDLSFMITMLYSVHPVLAQAVAWIPGRNDSLLGIFAFAGFIFLLEFIETKKIAKFFLHLLFFGLSIFTKESAMAVPFLGMLYIFLFCTEKWRPLLFSAAGYLVVLAPWYFLRQIAMQNNTADLSFDSLSTSFSENLPLYMQFIQKSILPFSLSVLSVPEDTYFPVAIALVLLIGFALMRSKDVNVKMVFFGSAWFSAFLLPGFVVHLLTGFEHRVYVPLIGILLVFSQIDPVKKFSFGRTAHLLSGIALFLVFAGAAFGHADTFKSSYAFWQKAAENSTHSALARMNYGLALSQNGEMDKALTVYKEGLELNPLEPMIHNNIGTIYGRQKMYDRAEEEFKKEIEINPLFSDAYFNLGILYKQTGKDSLMVRMWEKTLEVNPLNSGARKALENYRRVK